MGDFEDHRLADDVAVRHAERRLAAEFSGLEPATVNAVLEASYRHMDELATVKHHVPLLAERYARGQLWALARMQGHRPGVPGVLFLDAHDAGRAKMAKALLLAVAEQPVEVMSAGTRPDTDVALTVLEVMAEAGVELGDHFPKPYTDDMLRAADLLVTFGDAAVVSVPDRLTHEHWDYPDPRHLDLEATRDLREALAARVRELAERLGVAGSA